MALAQLNAWCFQRWLSTPSLLRGGVPADRLSALVRLWQFRHRSYAQPFALVRRGIPVHQLSNPLAADNDVAIGLLDKQHARGLSPNARSWPLVCFQGLRASHTTMLWFHADVARFCMDRPRRTTHERPFDCSSRAIPLASATASAQYASAAWQPGGGPEPCGCAPPAHARSFFASVPDGAGACGGSQPPLLGTAEQGWPMAPFQGVTGNQDTERGQLLTWKRDAWGHVEGVGGARGPKRGVWPSRNRRQSSTSGLSPAMAEAW